MTSPFFVGNQDYSQFAQSAYGSFTQIPQQQTGTPVTNTTGIDSNYGYGGSPMDTWGIHAQTPTYQQSQPQTGYHQAHQTHQQQNFGPIGGPVIRGSGGMRGRGSSRGRGSFIKPKPTGPRPIKATEIKAWLFEWCTQKKLKPEYTYEAKGKYPRVKYLCTLTIAGIDYKAQKEAKSKKEAQTECAVEFCDELVKRSYVAQAELPKKIEADKKDGVKVEGDKASSNGSDGKVSAGSNLSENGGWSTENARRRLNEFCMEERISCEFQTSSSGSVYAHVAISKLTLKLKRIEEPIVMTAQASNKKTANANCALAMVHELYKKGLIEKFGEPRITAKDREQNPLSTHHGQKRKAESDDVNDKDNVECDENGNWTLELARSRLSEFFIKQGKQLNCDEKESGGPFHKQFTCSCEITVDGTPYSAKSTDSTKKGAQKKCALDMIIQLYRAKLIQGNTGKRSKESTAKRQKGEKSDKFSGVRLSAPVIIPKWGTGRTTPYDDRHIRTKLEQLEQSEEEKVAIRTVVEEVMQKLQCISEKLHEEEKAEMKEGDESAEKKPDAKILVGCFPIGKFAKGLMLKNENDAVVLLQCRDKPTVRLLKKIQELLQKETEGLNYYIGANVRLASVEASREVKGIRVPVQIVLTSTKLRPNPDDSEENVDPEDVLPRNKCLEALAELRRANFFQARASPYPNCVAVCRILKEMTKNDIDWTGLNDWRIELLTQKAAESAGCPLTAGDLLRRVMMGLSSGLILSGGRGVHDPCERDNTDAFSELTHQEREDVTYKAQTTLRQISFMQIHVVLGIEKIEK